MLLQRKNLVKTKRSKSVMKTIKKKLILWKKNKAQKEEYGKESLRKV